MQRTPFLAKLTWLGPWHGYYSIVVARRLFAVPTFPYVTENTPLKNGNIPQNAARLYPP